MEVHLHPLREEGRESGAEQSAANPVGEYSKSTGQGEVGIYEKALVTGKRFRDYLAIAVTMARYISGERE